MKITDRLDEALKEYCQAHDLHKAEHSNDEGGLIIYATGTPAGYRVDKITNASGGTRPAYGYEKMTGKELIAALQFAARIASPTA